jgi:hypothetical protein
MLNQDKHSLLAIVAQEKFRGSAVHSSMTEGFELNCRQNLQKCLYQIFNIGIQDPGQYFEYSRKLANQRVIERVMHHYNYHSAEIDIYIYANPALTWHANEMPDFLNLSHVAEVMITKNLCAKKHFLIFNLIQCKCSPKQCVIPFKHCP